MRLKKLTIPYFLLLIGGIALSVTTNIKIAGKEENPAVITLFSHGLANNENQVYDYTEFSKNGSRNPYHTIIGETWTFDYPDVIQCLKDVPLLWKMPNVLTANLAQQDDIDCLTKAFDECSNSIQKERGDNYSIILYGVSRGASTILAFAALHPEKLQHVAAIVLESPFDALTSCRPRIEKVFQGYNKDFPTPIDFARRIECKSIPVCVVCSREDQRVPCKSTEKIHTALCESGHNASLITLDHGKHSFLLKQKNGSAGIDGAAYQNAVQDFYARHTIFDTK